MQEQQKKKTAKPQIEDVIHDAVKDERRQAALDFVGFIRSLKMTPAWASKNSWEVSYKGQTLCYIRTAGTAHYHGLDDGSWHINFAAYSDYVYDVPVSDEDIEAIAGKARYCKKCYNCAPANSLTINGKELSKICHQWLIVKNPDAHELDCMKKLVVAIRQSIADKNIK